MSLVKNWFWLVCPTQGAKKRPGKDFKPIDEDCVMRPFDLIAFTAFFVRKKPHLIDTK